MSEIVYWTQRDGTLISVDDMSVQHLRNTLKMIIRNNQSTLKKKHEFKLHGDMAQQFNDCYFDDEDNIGWNDGEFYKE